jgi:hypothetical protein
MRLFYTVLVLFFASLVVSAQTRAGQYIDVVYLHKGNPIEGTILSYEYEVQIVIVKEDGVVKELPWKEVKRVNFQFDRNRFPENSRQEAAENIIEGEENVLPTPAQKFRHQVTSALTFGNTTSSDFGRPGTALGGGFAYHLLRDISFLTVGAGLDVSLMNHQRRENVLAATVIVEVPIGKGRFRPFARIETGPTFLFGSGALGAEITSRSITPLYHPAVGVEITPRDGGWGKMTVDLGYRFLTSKFELTTDNLDVVERNVNYRRLTLRGGMRF